MTKQFLEADIFGSQIPEDCHFAHEIKAVTYHQLQIKQNKNRYETKIFFDI